MLEVGTEHGFYIRSDGTFKAFMGAIDLGDMILKSEPRGETKVWPFKGIASTADKDRDGEILLQKGLDFSPFIEHGELNWNHIPHAIIGLPVGKKAWFENGVWHDQGEIVAGMPIWKGYDTDMVVEQHNQFKKAGFERGLCQSVEGKVTSRSSDGRFVVKAKIINMALTFRPINPSCSITMLAKSMSGGADLMVRDQFYDDMQKTLSVSGAGPMMKQDLEGARKRPRLDAGLIRHLVKKGHTELQARAHVYRYLAERQKQGR